MLQCPVPHNVTWDGLCYGSGTTMFMNGFTSIASEERGSTECVNFLFIDWTLDSTVKYVFACIGTLLLGIATQGVGHARITLGKLRRNNYMKLQILVFYGVLLDVTGHDVLNRVVLHGHRWSNHWILDVSSK